MQEDNTQFRPTVRLVRRQDSKEMMMIDDAWWMVGCKARV